MTYEIKYEPVIIEKETYPKYNIYYYDGQDEKGSDILVGVELHSTDGINGTVRDGFVKKGDENKGLDMSKFDINTLSKEQIISLRSMLGI